MGEENLLIPATGAKDRDAPQLSASTENAVTAGVHTFSDNANRFVYANSCMSHGKAVAAATLARASVTIACVFLCLTADARPGAALFGDVPLPDCAERVRQEQLSRDDVRALAEQGSGFWSYCMFVDHDTGDNRNARLATHWLRRSADLGFAFAQFRLYKRLLDGSGMQRDEEEAAHWILQAADSGIAQFELIAAWTLESGEGIAADSAAAFRLMRRAAYGGVPIAQRELARYYTHGIGTESNLRQVEFWARRAAAQGDPQSLYMLGIGFHEGQFGRRNPILARALLTLALELGGDETHAQRELAKLELGLDPVDRAAGADLAKLWRPGVDLVEQMEIMLTSLQTGVSPDDIAGANAQAPRRRVATGSGFIVNTAGDVVTNRHVVEGCSSARILPGNIDSRNIQLSEVDDLAVIRTNSTASTAASISPKELPELGESILAAGYPLRSVLDNGLSITSGLVSAIGDMDGEQAEFQFSAAVQPGNSGGPVLNLSGQVVGVVVSRLDSDAVGTSVQNVNFAISLPSLLDFLHASRVPIGARTSAPELATKEVARRARQYVVIIECWE